jgi:hypothetical protein
MTICFHSESQLHALSISVAFCTYRQTETVVEIFGHNSFVSEMRQQEAWRKTNRQMTCMWIEFISCGQNGMWPVSNGSWIFGKGTPLQPIHNWTMLTEEFVAGRKIFGTLLIVVSVSSVAFHSSIFLGWPYGQQSEALRCSDYGGHISGSLRPIHRPGWWLSQRLLTLEKNGQGSHHALPTLSGGQWLSERRMSPREEWAGVPSCITHTFYRQWLPTMHLQKLRYFCR